MKYSYTLQGMHLLFSHIWSTDLCDMKPKICQFLVAYCVREISFLVLLFALFMHVYYAYTNFDCDIAWKYVNIKKRKD